MKNWETEKQTLKTDHNRVYNISYFEIEHVL